MEKFEILEKIDEKEVYSTFLCKHIFNDEKMIVQKILCLDPDLFIEKFKVLLDLNHENLVKYLEIVPEIHPPALSHGNCIYIFKKFYPFETLENLIQKEFISDEIYLSFAYQISDALAYLHNLGLIHGDLQPRRIFVDSNNNLLIDDFNLYGLFNDILPNNETFGNLNYLVF